jgi:hypothetical protein
MAMGRKYVGTAAHGPSAARSAAMGKETFWRIATLDFGILNLDF